MSNIAGKVPTKLPIRSRMRFVSAVGAVSFDA